MKVQSNLVNLFNDGYSQACAQVMEPPTPHHKCWLLFGELLICPTKELKYGHTDVIIYKLPNLT